MIKNIIKSVISSTLVFGMCVFNASATSEDTKVLMDKKIEQIEFQSNLKQCAHLIAEKARECGEKQHGDIIFLAKRHWETANEKQIALEKEYHELKTQYKKELEEEEEARRKAAEEAERIRIQQEKGRYLGTFKITAYTPSPSENGGYAITATGRPLAGNEWRIVAVDPRVIPLGSTLYIEGVGTVSAQDTGGAIKGNTLDLLVGYGQADSWGVQYRDVYIK